MAAEEVGQRPYEMVWAGRTEDSRPPTVDFENLDGWTVEVEDAQAAFERSREQLLWGKSVGKLTYRRAGARPVVRVRPPQPIGLLGTDPSFDEARQSFAHAAVNLAQLSAVEMALYRLISEQRKAQKRVNALKYNIIPSYKKAIKRIAEALEEEERGTLFQIKRLREAAERKDAAGRTH